MSNSSIWSLDRTLSGATTSGQSGPGSDGNEKVLVIPISSSITGTLPSDCLVSYPGHSLGWRVLPLCKDTFGIFYSPRWLGFRKCFSSSLPTNDWYPWFNINYIIFGIKSRKFQIDKVKLLTQYRQDVLFLLPSQLGVVEYTNCISAEA